MAAPSRPRASIEVEAHLAVLRDLIDDAHRNRAGLPATLDAAAPLLRRLRKLADAADERPISKKLAHEVGLLTR